MVAKVRKVSLGFDILSTLLHWANLFCRIFPCFYLTNMQKNIHTIDKFFIRRRSVLLHETDNCHCE